MACRTAGMDLGNQEFSNIQLVSASAVEDTMFFRI